MTDVLACHNVAPVGILLLCLVCMSEPRLDLSLEMGHLSCL